MREKKKNKLLVLCNAVVRHGGRQDFGIRSHVEKPLGTAGGGGLAALGCSTPNFFSTIPKGRSSPGQGSSSGGF